MALTAEHVEEDFPRQEIESAVIRFAGDSGDGMQLTGSQFTLATALQGNDLATFPDFPRKFGRPREQPSASPPSKSTLAPKAFKLRAIFLTCSS